MPDRIPLCYTFGNHHHWVDMEWLWGYQVTPDSLRDMLRYCAETGAKGNLNFDGVGYEKMAAECPEVLAELKEAIAKGIVEPVGCSYGQPYGLFHGSESNVRQRIFGVRAVMRLLGFRPRTFWEEEFDFFPQLPQLLKGCGFEFASLYFQWTWHTPEVPKEETPVVWWEAPDGSRLLTATRNRLNVHQWPEDFQVLLDGLAEGSVDGWKGGRVDDTVDKRASTDPVHDEGPGEVPPSFQPSTPPPLIQQWLELIPSPDWMCRSELMVPMLKKLLADERFEVRMCTLGEYLEGVREANPKSKISKIPPKGNRRSGQNPNSDLPIRRYSMSDVWHGMSLGKNGDYMRRLSRSIEARILAAEALSSTLGLFGRPYAQWDVYPVWELEEAWRELLQAQHHDNDECEGLCGRVGEASYAKGRHLADKVFWNSMRLLEGRTEAPAGQVLVFNPLGWARKAAIEELGGKVVELPALGYAAFEQPAQREERPTWKLEGGVAWIESGGIRVEVETITGTILQITSPEFPEGAIEFGRPALIFSMRRNGAELKFDRA